jgi:hypothetical protein
MYRVTIERVCEEEKELLVNSLEELRAVITLAEEENYEIVSVDRYDYTLAEEFLKEIAEKVKPEGLVYGKEEANGHDNEGNPIHYDIK